MSGGNGYYAWNPSSAVPGYYPASPPRTTAPPMNYDYGSDNESGYSHGSRRSHRSSGSHSSSKSAQGVMYIAVNGQPVAETPSQPSSSRQHRSRDQRGRVVVEPQPHRRTQSHNLAPLTPPLTPEPERIYIEENVSDARPPRRLIMDNPRRHHGRTNSREIIEVAPGTSSRPRQQFGSPPSPSPSHGRSRSRSSSVSQYSNSPHCRSNSGSGNPRRSSMKGSRPPSSIDKHVAFNSQEDVLVISPNNSFKAENDEINSRPAVPPYVRPAIHLDTTYVDRPDYGQDKMQDRLRRRQEVQPPHKSKKSSSSHNRRHTVSMTAPPLGIFYPPTYPSAPGSI